MRPHWLPASLAAVVAVSAVLGLAGVAFLLVWALGPLGAGVSALIIVAAVVASSLALRRAARASRQRELY